MNIFTPFLRLKTDCDAQKAADQAMNAMDDIQDEFDRTVMRLKQCDRREHDVTPIVERRRAAR